MKTKDDVLELDTRKKIYDVIRRNPGMHMTEIARRTGQSVPLVKYHLGQLERYEMVVPMEEGGFKRYFIRERGLRLTVEEKRKLGVLRRETPLRVALFLIDEPCSRHTEISRALDIPPSTLSFHLKKLVNEGIVGIDEERCGRKGYVVVRQRELIRILITFRPFFDRLADAFADLWMEIER